MCPPPEWLGQTRNKQLAQPALNAHFRQSSVVLDRSAGSTIGDTNDEPVDRQADRRNMIDFIKL